MYKAIFHVHTNYSYDAKNTIPFLLETCVKNNIQILVVTEHNNMNSLPALQEYISKNQLSIKLIPGEEIASQQGEVIGLFLKESIPKGLSLKETVAEIKKQNGVVYVPHPFDSFRKERIKNQEDLDSIIEDVDIIEGFNSRSWGGNAKATWYAKKHSKLILWGCDAHFPFEILNCIVNIPDFEMNRDSFLKAVKSSWLVYKKSSYRGSLQSYLLKKKIAKTNKNSTLS